MRGLLAFLAVTVGLVAGAEARVHHPYRGHRIVPAASAPLDAFTTPAAAYSLRKVRTAYAGPGIKLRRTTGGTQDINFLGATGFTGAPLDTAAANAFCAATTCFVDTWYDQSGSARNVVQATAANQPQFIFNCIGTLPCIRVTADGQMLAAGAGVLVMAAPISIGGVAIRSAGTSYCKVLYSNLDQLYGSVGGGGWTLQAGGDQVGVFAADGAWHALIGVINGAASVLRSDATEGTGTAAAVTGSVDAIQAGVGAPATTCSFTEALLWSGYGLTAGERAALTANQRSFWGF